MQDGLEVLALTRVLAIKELQQPHHERLVYVLLRRLGFRVIGDHVPQQELVHYLQNTPLNVSAKSSLTLVWHSESMQVQDSA